MRYKVSLKKIQRKNLHKLINFYILYFKLNWLSYYIRFTLNIISTTLFIISQPKKQLIFTMYHNVMLFQKSLTTGAFLNWGLVRSKFFKKQPKSFTPILLLFWNYYYDLLVDTTFFLLKGFNMYVYLFLLQMEVVLELVPLNFLIKKANINYLLKPRRIKKNYLKIIKSD